MSFKCSKIEQDKLNSEVNILKEASIYTKEMYILNFLRLKFISMRDLKDLIANYNKERVFIFKREDVSFVLIGYPEWQAFAFNGYKITVLPDINVNYKTLYLPSDVSLHRDHNGTPKQSLNNEEIILIDKFFSTIPFDVIELIKRFPDSHWSLIETLINIGAYFKTLIISNPAVAYLLCNISQFNPAFKLIDEIEYVKELILKKQREILRICFFPDTEAAIKSFSRINIMDLNVPALLKLSNIVRSDPTVQKWLSQFQNITKHHFLLLNEYKDLIRFLSSNFITELTESNEFRQHLQTLTHIISIAKTWQINIPKFKALLDLESCGERIDTIAKKKKEALEKFPEPPIPDNKFVKALRNINEIELWARKQNNCIRNYIPQIKANKLYLYKVIIETGEEATLEILIKKEKRLEFGQLSGENNETVSKELFKVAKLFFNKSKDLK